MNRADIATSPLWSGSGDPRCNPMQAVIALRLSSARNSGDMRRLNGGGSDASDARHQASPSASTLANALSRSLGRRSGQFADSMDLTATRSEDASVMQFVLGSTTSAAVLLLDAPVLFQIPRCDWESPLLRARNRLSDDGFKVYAVLVNACRPRNLPGALHRLHDRYEAVRFARFCDANGVGLLGNDEVPVAQTRNEAEDGLASSIASALISARHFCCGAFRIGKPGFATRTL